MRGAYTIKYLVETSLYYIKRQTFMVQLHFLCSEQYRTFNVVCGVLCIMDCTFVLFFLAIVLSVLRYTDSDYLVWYL